MNQYAENSDMDTGLPTMGHMIWRWLEIHGLDAEQGLSRHDLQSHSQRVPSDKWEAVVAHAIGAIDDDCSGLAASECWRPSNLGTLGYSWLASSNLRTSFQRMSCYMRVVGDRGRLITMDTPQGFKLSLLQRRAEVSLRETIADFAMALMFAMARMNFWASLTATGVTLRRRDLRGALWMRGAVCRKKEDSFTLALRDIDIPLPSAEK